MDAALVLRNARMAARLTQRQLALAAGVPQSTVARIESGVLVPRVDTLVRLIEAAGFELKTQPRPGFGVDRTLIVRQLQLSPAERLRSITAASNNVARLVRSARRTQPG